MSNTTTIIGSGNYTYTVEIVDYGSKSSNGGRYEAHVGYWSGRLYGRRADTRAQAKQNLLDDIIAIALFEPIVVELQTGGRVEVTRTGATSYEARIVRADGDYGGSCGSGTEEDALRYAAFIADRDGLKHIQGYDKRLKYERAAEAYQVEKAERERMIQAERDRQTAHA